MGEKNLDGITRVPVVETPRSNFVVTWPVACALALGRDERPHAIGEDEHIERDAKHPSCGHDRQRPISEAGRPEDTCCQDHRQRETPHEEDVGVEPIRREVAPPDGPQVKVPLEENHEGAPADQASKGLPSDVRSEEEHQATRGRLNQGAHVIIGKTQVKGLEGVLDLPRRHETGPPVLAAEESEGGHERPHEALQGPDEVPDEEAARN
mmetsp:Transcript_45485/g.114514  ORF Transcript_45485/g.114514 Transcript_45485/m.114514 type:complete len:209 (+) Transcript_45485:725-1351(+)